MRVSFAKSWGPTVRGVAAFLVSPLLALPLAAQEEGPNIDGRPWRILLEQQLSAEKTCDLVEVLMFDEYKDGDKTILEGKVRCLDGRQFDFLRKNEHQKFKLDLCQPAVC